MLLSGVKDSSSWKDKNFTVTLCHSILGGGTDCEMRIEVDR